MKKQTNRSEAAREAARQLQKQMGRMADAIELFNRQYQGELPGGLAHSTESSMMELWDRISEIKNSLTPIQSKGE